MTELSAVVRFVQLWLPVLLNGSFGFILICCSPRWRKSRLESMVRDI